MSDSLVFTQMHLNMLDRTLNMCREVAKNLQSSRTLTDSFSLDRMPGGPYPSDCVDGTRDSQTAKAALSHT